MKKALRFLFCLYLLLLIYLLFFSEAWGRSLWGDTYQYNLVPFREIRRYIEYAHQIGELRAVVNLMGNVVGFIPFGFCFPALWERHKSFWKTALVSFELSLVIEVSQLILRAGSCDVDDVILNTLGGCIGYGIYRAVARRKNAEKETI